MDTGNLRKVSLNLPATDADLAGLRLADVVFLNGLVYTAREGVYEKVLVKGEKLPDEIGGLSNVNFHCSPAASWDGEKYRIGGVTATASFRFGKYMGDWLDRTGTKIIIGKGGMAAEDYKKILAPRGVLYFTTVGYGTGALLGRGVKGVRAVHWLDELGLAQAMWLFEVENFGPFLVESDHEGNSLFAQQGEQINKGIGGLYEGLKPPALHRYGETDDRSDEVM